MIIIVGSIFRSSGTGDLSSTNQDDEKNFRTEANGKCMIKARENEAYRASTHSPGNYVPYLYITVKKGFKSMI